MNEIIENFLISRGIPYYDIQDPTDVLLDICDAEEFIRLASQEQVPIIGAEVFEGFGGNNYSVDNTFDLAWSCECKDGEDTSNKSYYERSIEMAKNALQKVHERIPETHGRLYINYCVRNDDQMVSQMRY